ASELQRELEDADAALMEAVVAGCALVAYSDGWVSPEETLRMRRLILRFEPAKALGLAEILRLFEEMTLSFADNFETGEQAAFELVSRLAGRHRESDLLIDTCCGIADADGGFDAEERETILKLCAMLQIEPETHGL
ncbi:MAG: tellurite resistance TerB family protein, partial [Rhodospirillales bacterium]|nr:tellurite resistance TerB family protein [Rhodospirillales bacterium]